jgi:L-2-hydroxyglutarate oxidase
VIVAVDSSELPRLERIYQRGQENGVRCEIIDVARLRDLEPHATGIQAIHVPSAGIVDYARVCERLAEIVCERHGHIEANSRVSSIEQSSALVTADVGGKKWTANILVNCAGLHSDRVTRQSGCKPSARIVPFRGEYFVLSKDSQHLCRNLIYPVPDPSFPFLGVHFTRCIDGTVECGPNAVLAFAREGYTKTTVNLRDLAESLTYPGFLRLATRYWRVGAAEMWRSLSKRAFVRALQRLVPEIRAEHLTAAPAGVRAQAVTPDGAMVDDFVIQRTGRVVNVGNAPSPAATSSLNIGAIIVDQL